MTMSELKKWGSEMHGKKIKAVFWPRSAGTRQDEIRASEDCEIILCESFHGDHDEVWIVVCENGIEVERHNPRHVESIIWE